MKRELALDPLRSEADQRDDHMPPTARGAPARNIRQQHPGARRVAGAEHSPSSPRLRRGWRTGSSPCAPRPEPCRPPRPASRHAARSVMPIPSKRSKTHYARSAPKKSSSPLTPKVARTGSSAASSRPHANASSYRSHTSQSTSKPRRQPPDSYQRRRCAPVVFCGNCVTGGFAMVSLGSRLRFIPGHLGAVAVELEAELSYVVPKERRRAGESREQRK